MKPKKPPFPTPPLATWSSFDGENWRMPPIGVVRSAFTEKFGIPRQPGLTPEAKGVIELHTHEFFKPACKELEKFSHLWVIFVFHANASKDWKPAIRPPVWEETKK